MNPITQARALLREAIARAEAIFLREDSVALTVTYLDTSVTRTLAECRAELAALDADFPDA